MGGNPLIALRCHKKAAAAMEEEEEEDEAKWEMWHLFCPGSLSLAGFLKRGCPKIIHFTCNRIYMDLPFWTILIGVPPFMETPFKMTQDPSRFAQQEEQERELFEAFFEMNIRPERQAQWRCRCAVRSIPTCRWARSDTGHTQTSSMFSGKMSQNNDRPWDLKLFPWIFRHT